VAGGGDGGNGGGRPETDISSPLLVQVQQLPDNAHRP